MAASTSGSAMCVPLNRKYLQTLTNESRKKYQEKLNLINNIDPYNVSSNFFTDSVEMWPNVEYPDIVTYFLCSTSRYTKEQIKAYKSLESYQYFVAGWVRCVFVGKATSNIKILLGKVSNFWYLFRRAVYITVYMANMLMNSFSRGITNFSQQYVPQLKFLYCFYNLKYFLY